MEKTFNGWLNIYKEKGQTSFSISRALKKKFKFKKIGHLGTLDPLAKGVLPIAVGEATKTINFITMVPRWLFGPQEFSTELSAEMKEASVLISQPEPINLILTIILIFII